MMVIIIPGECVPKARPRVKKIGYAYTEPKTLRYENYARKIFKQHCDQPTELSEDIFDTLDNVYWDEFQVYQRATDLIFSESDKKELNKMLSEWINKKVEASDFYVIEDVSSTMVIANED